MEPPHDADGLKPDRKPYSKPGVETAPQGGGKGGAPRKIIDLALVETLAKLCCPDHEIAEHVGVSLSTLKNRKNDDPEFLAVLKRGRAHAKKSIRKAQFEKAKEGNVTMLIWLGKQMLGQRDDPGPVDTGDDGQVEELALGVDTGTGVVPVIVKPGASLEDMRAVIDVTERPSVDDVATNES